MAWAELKSSGITSNTPENIMLGAGTIHKGLQNTGATYALTTDTDIVSGKTYYTRSGTSPNFTYEAVASPVKASLSTYYEMTSSGWNFEESLICATSGGTKVSITPELYDVPVDGALVKVMGLTVKVGETAKVETNLVELSNDILKMVATAEEKSSSSITGWKELVSKRQIKTGDYIENFGYIGHKLTGEPIVIIFDYALCTSGMEVEGKNKEAGVFPATFECFAELSPEADILPYHIFTPV